MLTRREMVQYLAVTFALPIYPQQVHASAEHVPLHMGHEVPDALALGLEQVQELGQAYMLPGTDSKPVSDRALALWRDANAMRTKARSTKIMNHALELEGMAAIIVAHVFAERGLINDARSWFRRSTDAARIMWPDDGDNGNQTGRDLLARAELLCWLDQGKHLTHPADTVELSGKMINLGTTGSARAMALSVRARAESLMAPNSERAQAALVEAGEWALVDSGQGSPLSLFTYTPRQHDYVAAGVYATTGNAELSRAHRASYLTPGLPQAGFMNACLLDLGEADNVQREHGPAAAATHVLRALQRVPAPRRSAPIRDRAIALTYGYHAGLSSSGKNVPKEIKDLGDYVNAMRSPDYLATIAA